MTVSSTPRFTFVRALGPIVLVSSTALLAAEASASPGRMTAAANITLRQAPSADAPVVAFLPLGTEVTDAGPSGLDKTWVHVHLSDNREGWLLANLTREIDPAHRTVTVERIILDRLDRHGDGFASAVELSNFVERELTSVTEPQAAARFDLYRLRAVAEVLSTIRSGQDRRDPCFSWLDRHKGLVVYDKPGSTWLLSNAAVWQMHDQHPTSAVADDIAWIAAGTGLPGECAGSLVCYAESLDRLDGEYLRRHPTGHHVDEAVNRIGDAAAQLSPTPRTLYVFDRSHDCTSLGRALDSLEGAVATSNAVGKDGTVQHLAAIRGVCGPR